MKYRVIAHRTYEEVCTVEANSVAEAKRKADNCEFADTMDGETLIKDGSWYGAKFVREVIKSVEPKVERKS